MRSRPVIVLIRQPLSVFLCLFTIISLLSSSVKFIAVLGEGLKNKTIVIDAGHGGQDPGAQYNGFYRVDAARSREIPGHGLEVFGVIDRLPLL
ncbi:hypothetical protein [Desulfosporosinus sp. FKA]|uniref:hypothetical protein n=1 Tax=Desulfosporosinus sp. FKA TaxID=1969834 RepID=UPI000B4A23B5|nr:hypothetical protein [Desulfosporosinus sp. FKA]